MRRIRGAGPGDRTAVDALEAALDALENGFSAAALAARAGAGRTVWMRHAKAGRAAHVGADRPKSNVDPGAEAVARLFEGLSAGIRQRTVHGNITARVRSR